MTRVIKNTRNGGKIRGAPRLRRRRVRIAIDLHEPAIEENAKPSLIERVARLWRGWKAQR
jgi:hypothetical protein